MESTLGNASEILSLLEILLCFVKRTVVRDGDKSIKVYVSLWISIYDLTPGGFIKIKYIHECKAPLSADIKNAVDFKQPTTTKRDDS